MTPKQRAADALRTLERMGSAKVRDELLPRYGISARHAFGVPVGAIQKLGKQLGRDHDLALALWETGWYEARLLTAYVDEPEKVTAAQMDRWARAFDNWGVCDTLCFALWDRTPHAWKKAVTWCARRDEFVRRAGFTLIACLALHDRTSDDARFLPFLGIIEKGAGDERNFVKKAVSWALRSLARRPGLRAACREMAERLNASDQPAARWVARDTLRGIRPAARPRRASPRRASGRPS